MWVKFYLSIMIVVFMASCSTTAATTDSNQSEKTIMETSASLTSTRRGIQKRYLRNSENPDKAAPQDGDEDHSDSALTTMNDEERAVSVSTLKNLKVNDITYVSGSKYIPRWNQWAIVERFYKKLKQFATTTYWNIRYVGWFLRGYTPLDMYKRLKVMDSTPFDENYRLFLSYFNFYEFVRGPVKNPLYEFGPYAGKGEPPRVRK